MKAQNDTHEVFNLYEGTEGNSRCYKVLSRDWDINEIISDNERIHKVERFFKYLERDFERVNPVLKNSYSVHGSSLTRCLGFGDDLFLITKHPESTKKVLEELYPEYRLEHQKNNFDI
jgi:hypothetical protein